MAPGHQFTCEQLSLSLLETQAVLNGRAGAMGFFCPLPSGGSFEWCRQAQQRTPNWFSKATLPCVVFVSLWSTGNTWGRTTVSKCGLLSE